MTKVAGSGYGSISQRHGTADPDPYQNVTDPLELGKSFMEVKEEISIIFSSTFSSSVILGIFWS
jgi:hypothetical protein